MTEKKEAVVSPNFSFKGWKLSKWFVGNWTTIKEIFKVALPAVIGWVATQNEIYTGLITIFGKFLLDAGEYYVKEYTK